jgi:hypothetical protein
VIGKNSNLNKNKIDEILKKLKTKNNTENTGFLVVITKIDAIIANAAKT